MLFPESLRFAAVGTEVFGAVALGLPRCGRALALPSPASGIIQAWGFSSHVANEHTFCFLSVCYR